MRLIAAEKREVIRLVDGSDLSVRQTLRELQVPRATFYTWYRRYAEADDRVRNGDAQPLRLACDTASWLGTRDVRVLDADRHSGGVIPGANTLFVWSGVMFGIAFAGLGEDMWRR